MTEIIVEFCQNHNGSISLLKEMVWAAKENGAAYAKIQTIFADDVTYRPEFEEGKIENGIQKIIKRPCAAEKNRLKPLELSEKDHHIFLETCQKAKILPLTTVFSRHRIPLVKSLGFSTIKVASIDCASFPMIRELAEQFDSLIISTGGTYDDEIRKTASILKNKKFSFLHCVTRYPTPLDKLNLRRMNFLLQFTPSVGFSDHSAPAKDGLKASFIAISLGASVIERHFTLLKPEETRDGPVSINPKQLSELTAACKLSRENLNKKIHAEISSAEYESMIGIENPGLSEEELLNRNYYRGRFASHCGKDVIYNWEEREVPSIC